VGDAPLASCPCPCLRISPSRLRCTVRHPSLVLSMHRYRCVLFLMVAANQRQPGTQFRLCRLGLLTVFFAVLLRPTNR
jgi:hypothetical protein